MIVNVVGVVGAVVGVNVVGEELEMGVSDGLVAEFVICAVVV